MQKRETRLSRLGLGPAQPTVSYQLILADDPTIRRLLDAKRKVMAGHDAQRQFEALNPPK